MNRRSARTVFKVRPATSERKGWLRLVDAARTAAGRASGAAFGDDRRGDTLSVDIKHMLRDARASDFPLQEASAVHLAQALLSALRAFAEALTPERREAAAPVMRAAADAVMNMLGELYTAEADATWKRRLPASERD
jgi:hypothetical protein